MTLIRFLLKKCRLMVILMIAAALISGACNAGLLALINHVINTREATVTILILAFVALLVGKVGTGFLSQIWLVRFFQGTIAELRRDLVKKVIDVPLRQYEGIGAGRVMAALTDDIASMTAALFCFPTVMVNIAILIGGGIYMAWLSWKMVIVMAAFILVGAIAYRLLIVSGFRFLHNAREAEDRLFKHFRAMTEGLKELKLHRDRRDSFLRAGLHEVTDEFKHHSVAAEKRFLIAHSWSHLLFYTLIGIIIFLMPLSSQMDFRTLTGYVLTTLYLMGPLAGVMGSISVFTRAEVALRKINSLGLTLEAQVTHRQPTKSLGRSLDAFNRLDLCGVSHSYPHEQGDEPFVLGPLDLTFRPGELVFIVGGNGSGKSTLAKIVTGLYRPETGNIYLDGTQITDANRDDYRQLFSAVYSDFYLFDDLLGLKATNLDARANEYLVKFHLNHKVRVQNGTLSTTSLSQGQRKRLALMIAYLEDRPFYIFDEWAADQDPHFKEIFYMEILQDLRQRGKTIVVISHDDRYFHVADRVLKLDYGQIMTAPEHEISISQLPLGISSPN